jgi:hypothetical protein
VFPAAFAICRCLSPDHGSVSRRRSSNRTCGSPASGSRTGFTTGHARDIADYPAPRKGALRLLLGPAIKLLPETLDNRVLALRQYPILAPFMKCSRTRALSLHRHYPRRRYHEPLRLPRRPRLTLSGHPGWWRDPPPPPWISHVASKTLCTY